MWFKGVLCIINNSIQNMLIQKYSINQAEQ